MTNIPNSSFLIDFGLVSSLVFSNSGTAPYNNGGSLADADVNKLRLYGSSFLSKSAEGDLPPSKAARISPCIGLSGPFTLSQWMELEHQALIYKYMTANVPIPSYLLNPIKKALDYSGLSSCFTLLRPNAGGFHMGFWKSDGEAGRCRRTDGKKWRCSRESVADQKYCKRHMNRGRHRSRKPVEGQHAHQPTTNAETRCLLNGGDEGKSEWPKSKPSISPFEDDPISVGGPLGEALRLRPGTRGLMLPFSPAL